MGKKNKNWIYGYSAATHASLNSIKLPDKVRCCRCLKWKAQTNFSHKQLNDAKYTILNGGLNAPFNIKCRTCAGGPLTEVECFMCSETKGIEEFAKSQRCKPDHAKCMACVEKQLELEPIQEDKYDDPRGAYRAPEWNGEPYPDYWNPASISASSKTITGASTIGDEDNTTVYDGAGGGGISLAPYMDNYSLTGSLISTEVDPYPPMSHGNSRNGGPVGDDKGWEKAKIKSWNSKPLTHSDASITGSVSSAFDPTKYGHPATRASDASGSKSFNSTATENSKVNTSKTGWAKIKAYKPPPKPVPVEPDNDNEDDDEDDDWKSDDDDDDGTASDRSI
ncbi:hypothetical protein GQ43DRAFT_473713 [Delitschia confertaspora ATCC 74209]|uniref:Stc1 domain-containing protein n=1 Tax=Delitschia confertaspora ATCC 74209 TaxID=1513339 RepID=A0A9P4MTR8_9PLEO|nr:hypothetical protein GQ43DRAFT_473713 [Delitschia confertaspora ATCC 74209]